MTLTHLLDTSVYSQPIKDRPNASALLRWSGIGDGAVCTSAVCQGEILHGLELRSSEKYWHRYRSLLENRYPILAFDASVAAAFARLAAETRRLGAPKPALDLMIAATAKCHGLIVATLNARDFSGLPGVAMEDWSQA
jgi:predicted nucleic acid-binding protein